MLRRDEPYRLQPGNTAEVFQPRQHLLNSLKPSTPYENTTIAIKRYSHLCRSCYRALCGWLRWGGIRKHNISAYGGGIPCAHPADAEATADLCRPATVPGPSGHRERKNLLRL